MSDEIVVVGQPGRQASGFKVFEPHLSVKLVKASPRLDLVEGTSTAQRTWPVQAIDLTPFLSENGIVRTTKSVRAGAGSFSITFADSPYNDPDRMVADPGSAETLYALIEPMDLIEIRMARSPEGHENGIGPVVMRGFVSDVTRNEAMAGDKPQRTVTINGHDFGKILQIIQIFYLNNSVVGDNILSELSFFHKYAEAEDAKIKPANEFVADMVDQVVNPYLAELTALADGSSVGAEVVNSWTVRSSIDGVVSPYTLSSFNNIPLGHMLEAILDIGPFNELYTEDTETGVDLVVRPAPFLDPNGSPIQGEAETVEAHIEEVVSMNVSRSDAGVANYYWVVDNRWTMMNNEESQRAAQIGQEQDYVLFEYLNSQSRLYGFRKMEVQTLLGPPDFSNSDAVRAEKLPENVDSLGGWLAHKRKILADSNKDNILFEHGSITMRGNENIRAGQRLVLTRGNGTTISFYVVAVDHEFAPFGGFRTRLMVERGTGFIQRSRSEQSLYYPETVAGGAR